MNIQVEEENEASILNLYRRLIALRRAHSVLAIGVVRSVTVSGNLPSVERATDAERLLIFLNLSHGYLQATTEAGIVIAGTDSRRNMERVNNLVELQGSEGLVIAITP